MSNYTSSSLGGWVVVPAEVGVGDDLVDFVVGEDEFQDVSMLADRKSRKVVVLSTRNTHNANRWSDMPPMDSFADSLMVLDLHKSKYLRSLHESVGDLSCLKRLFL